jgi:regulator of RNase E activity RraB
MGSVKDLYLEEVERIAADLEERGEDPDRAYDIASNMAHETWFERLADAADRARDLAKERF